MSFHPGILRLKKRILDDDADESEKYQHKILRILTEPEDQSYLPEYYKMWETVFKHCRNEDWELDYFWVYGFLSNVCDSSKMPDYYYISNAERKKLVEKIERYSKQLLNLYKLNDLDINIVHLDGMIFNGFYVYEDFGESNQARIDQDNDNKMPISKAINAGVSYSKERILEANTTGKAGKNVKAIRFIRNLAERNAALYEKPLYNVIATATFALYGIEYNESDISNILRRTQDR